MDPTNDLGLFVDVKVRLFGTSRHRQKMEEMLDANGWAIISGPGSGVFSSDSVDDSGYFTVQIPVGDVYVRQAGQFAQRKLLGDARRKKLHVEPVETNVLARESFELPTWYECEPPMQNGSIGQRKLFNSLRWMGYKDTGNTFTGSRALAERKFGTGRVRGPFSRSDDQHDHMPYRPEGVAWREALELLTIFLLSGFFGILFSVVPGSSRLILVALAIGCGSRAVVLARRSEGSSAKQRAALLAVGMVTSAFFVGAIASSLAGGREILLVSGAVALLIPTVRGISLLRGRWRGRTFALSWLLVLIPVIIPWVFGSGTALHALYGSKFELPFNRMEASGPQKFFASLYVTAYAAVFLALALALWGYVTKIFPLMHHIMVPVAAFIVISAALLVFFEVALQPAGDAGERAFDDWERGRFPQGYFGIVAEPVCVVAVNPRASIPGYGPVYDPRAVYAYFGIVDSRAILWSPASKKGFTVAADDVRILPVTSGRPGERIPRRCP